MENRCEAAMGEKKISGGDRTHRKLEDINGRLKDLVSSMETRLSPVLLPAIPRDVSKEEVKKAPPLVGPLFTAYAGQIGQINATLDALEDLLSRVDV